MATHTVTTTHKWQINSVSQLVSYIKNRGSISSDVFSRNGNSKAQFSIKLEDDNDGNFHVCLVRMTSERNQEMELKMKHWRENSRGAVETGPSKTFKFDDYSNISVFEDWYPLVGLRQCSINNTLVIYCEIQREESLSEFDESDPDDDLTMRSEFGQKLLELHSDGHFDLAIQAGGKEFKASKLTLMACSDYFRRMLSCPNSIEAKTGIIKIENTKPEVIEALIHWVYQINVDNMEEIAMELYQVADKYEISPLKKKCIKAMAKSLSTENIAPCLILAYKFREEKFKQHTLNFIRGDYNKLASLMTSEEWLEFCREHPEEAKKIGVDILN